MFLAFYHTFSYLSTVLHVLFDISPAAPVLDQCLQTWTTPVLGPLWLSKGEGFSPMGVKEFLDGLIGFTKSKLRDARHYKKQLQLAGAEGEEDKKKVEIVALLSMSDKEIENALGMVSDWAW